MGSQGVVWWGLACAKLEYTNRIAEIRTPQVVVVKIELTTLTYMHYFH